MTSKVWSKKQTQQTIRDLRKAGYDVVKQSEGFYKCEIVNDAGQSVSIFTALIGHNGYLVKHHPKLFGEVDDT